MKLTTWNCARGFEKKKRVIFSTAPDIAVIQECSKKSTESLLFDSYDAAWVGVNPNIGMGVFYRKTDWSVRRLEDTTHGIEWVVPFEVTCPDNFTLDCYLGVRGQGSKRESYVGQINRALRKTLHKFRNRGLIV